MPISPFFCARRRLVLLLAGFVFPVTLSAQAVDAIDADLRGRIDRIAAQVLAQTGVPSASVAVVQHGKLVYAHAYGDARLAAPGEPAIPATSAMRYSIGSISKQFTAAAILLLQQEGKLSIDDPVGKYVSGLTRGSDVTIREILSHTSGYQDYWPEDYVMTTMMVPSTPEHILDVWGKKPLDFEPGTEWQYSNTNYVIAGRIAEIVVGKPLMKQLRERIFGPLGMTGVFNSDASRLPETDPTGYYRHALGPLRPAPAEGAGWMFAAGELAMPARDLALWNISLMNRTLLSKASYDAMFAEVKLKDGKGSGYGLGVDVGERNGHRFIAHSGEVSGFVAQNVVYPDDKVAVTVLTNEDASSAAGALAQRIAPLVLATASEEDPVAVKAAEARALKIFIGLQHGQLDRSQLTELCSAYFTPEAMEDFESSLKPLGVPKSFTQALSEMRGGMRFRVFRADFGGSQLRVTVYEEPDGKLEQYLVIPPGS